MAAPIYTTDLTDISTAENVTNWDESSNADWDDGGGPDSENDYFIQGGACVSQTFKTGVASLIYDNTNPVTFGNDDVVLAWHYNQCPNALGTFTQGGIRQIVGNTLGDFYAWTVLGSDTYEYGGWECIPVHPDSATAEYTVGSPNGTWTFFGSAHNQTGEVFKGNPMGIDVQRYGRARSIFLEGDLANGYCTFEGFATQNDSGSTRWGLIQEIDGGYLWQGLMQLGDSGGTTSVDFRDSNVSISINDTIKATPSFNRIEIWNTGSRVDWDNIIFTALGTTSRGEFEVIDNADINFESCSFTGMDTFIFQSLSTINNTTFRNTKTINQSGATFSGCLFADISGSTHLLVDDLSLISSCDFESPGFGHGIELTTSASGQSYTLTDFIFTGYTEVDGSTGNEAIYNNSLGHVQLTIDGGNTPSIRNSVGSTTEFVTSVVLSLTVINSNGDPIEGAYAYIDQDNEEPFIMNTLTNASGIATTTWTGGSIASSTWRVRKYGYKPYIATTNIPASGTKDIPVTLIVDLQQT